MPKVASAAARLCSLGDEEEALRLPSANEPAGEPRKGDLLPRGGTGAIYGLYIYVYDSYVEELYLYTCSPHLCVGCLLLALRPPASFRLLPRLLRHTSLAYTSHLSYDWHSRECSR